MEQPALKEWNEEDATTSSDVNDADKFSTFSYGSCGEPLMPQHIVVDFTIQDDLDTDAVQEKCCAFWDFVENCPELKGMKVMPNVEEQYPLPTPTLEEEQSTESAIPCERTALSMLEIMERDGIDHLFETKLPKSQCSLGPREYPAGDFSTARLSNYKPKKSSKSACDETGHAVKKEPLPFKTTWKMIEEWDKSHPKSFDPPSHQPALFECKMQKYL